MKKVLIYDKVFLFVLIVSAACFSTTLFSQQKIGNRFIKQGTWKNRQIEYVDRQILLKVKEGVTLNDIAPFFSQHNIVIVEGFDRLRWGLIEGSEGRDIFPIIEILKNNNMIEAVEPNGVSHALVDPNDQYFLDGHQWSLKNTGQNPPDGTVDADIDAPEAWDITQGTTAIKIAILDSGIPKIDGDLSHPDLNDYGKITQMVDYVNEGNEGIYGKCKDYYGHGSHVAGIIAANTNNTTGIAGIANGCSIYIYKVFNSSGLVDDNSFKNAVLHADASGVNVINYSGSTTGGLAALQAVQDAFNYHVLLVVASGNDSSIGVVYPAAYSSVYSNVIAVGATDQYDHRSSYSSYGYQLNVVAPGGYGRNAQSTFGPDNIYSTTPNYTFTLNSQGYTTQNYGYLGGTSMAAPVVSAIAGLMLSKNSNLLPDQIRSTIEHTADDKGPSGRDDEYGWGRVNAHNALLAVVGPQNFRVTNSSGYVNLAWDPIPASALQYYVVERNINGWGWQVVATTTNTSYTDNYFELVRRGSDAAQFRIRSLTIDNVYSLYSNILSVTGTSHLQQGNPLAVAQLVAPTEYDLSQNYPNPFNPATTISYAVPDAGTIHLSVFDYLGREVATLVNEYKDIGYYETNFDASRLSSGTYFYKIQAGNFRAVKKMLLMK